MKIALTQRILTHKGREYDSIERSWYSVLKEHTLFFIPNDKITDVDADLLIVTGGGDHPDRLEVERSAILSMISKSKPIIGICHGAFLLTEMLGGIVSDVSDHMDVVHDVVMDNNVVLVNSYHSKLIKQHPEGAVVLAKTIDGQCESWIYKNIGAIVWHPERMSTPYWPEKIKELFNEKEI